MNNLIVRYRIITNRGGGYDAGNFVSVFRDDLADATVVIKYDDALDTVGVIQSTGPDLGADRYDYQPVSSVRPIPYKFCDGTTLNTYGQRSTFPYINEFQTPNHFSCNVIVCDIRIIGSETTNASDSTTADGAIHVTAETSSPPVRYSMSPTFSDGGQLSSDFNGFLAGTYTIYAKDTRGCSTSVDVTIGTPTGYGPKYRLEYYDLNEFKTRIDILERGYDGDIIEVCGSGDPFILKYNADGQLNKFTPVVPSEARLTLLSPSNFFFRELFSQDERKYKIEYYKDFGVITPGLTLLPALHLFDNYDGSGAVTGPHWTTGLTPTVTLTSQEHSIWLSALVNVGVGSYAITYDIDVASHDARIGFFFHKGSAVVGSFILPVSVGNNSGTFQIDASQSPDRLVVQAIQGLTELPPLNEWLSRSEQNRAPWNLDSDPSIALYSPERRMSQVLYATYHFTPGQSYTISIVINKTHNSGFTSTAVLYYAIRDAAFFPQYQPFGKQMNGGSGTYTNSFTFTAGDNFDIIGIQIYTEGVEDFEVFSVSITSSSLDGTTVTINELQSVTPAVDGFQLKWTGFVISSNYSEPYTPDPYPVTIIATDGLVDLKNKDFTDRYDNKFTSDIVTMDAILNILRKTDLGINLISAVNRLEVDMSTNALTESQFNPDTFYSSDGSITNCYDVLQQIVKIFACRLFQRNGKWIISTIEEAVHEFNAMEFQANGTFVKSLTIQDIMPITGPIPAQEAAFTWMDQNLEVVPAYGVFSFQHSLIENPSLVKSYSFEDTDVFTTPDGVTAFKAWNVNIGNAPGAEYGIKETRSFDGAFNFYWKVPYVPFAEPGWSLTITSTEGLIEYEAIDLIQFSFDYSVLTGKLTNNPYGAKPHYPFWVRLKWSLRIGVYYFDDISGEWTTSKKYNDIYVDQFNDPQNFKLVLPPREVTSLTLESFQVEFVMYDNDAFDFTINEDDYSEFDAMSTVNLSIGYRVKGRVIYTTPRGETVRYMYWQLNDEDSASDGDATRRPTDYNATTNQKVWVLQENSLVRRVAPRGSETYRVESPSPEIPVKYVYMDNVILRLLPGGTEPPKNITIERVNNLNIKIDYPDTFLLNDIDIDNINNSERTYKNFFKKLDGSPTQLWERTYRSGQGKLMELYSADFMSQYKQAVNKLTGSMILKNEITFATLLRELYDNNKLYMLMGMELHDRDYSIIFDMLELKDVVNDDTSEAIDAGFTSGFSLGFRS